MAGNMADYLSVKAPDYSTTSLELSPQDVLTETATRNQVVHEMDDGTKEVISLSENNIFTVTLSWEVLTEEEADTLFDFWIDSDKANGYANTFKWEHPTDSHIYVARFASDISKDISTSIYGIASIDLCIEGYVS